MDFFAAQTQAKQRTRWAIVFFCLSVVAVVFAVYAAFSTLAVTFNRSETGIPLSTWWNAERFFNISWITGIIIFTASAWRLNELSAGGLWVAELMGAQVINPHTLVEQEKRLVNIVEEMSIASGYPVPAVALLRDERSVNAFAAAMGTKDAVVCVTQGALDTFTREELQAVIGHEFSHLLNGDSKLNLTLHGWIYGLFAINIIGQVLLRNMSQTRSNSRNSGSAQAVIAIFCIALIIIGYVGVLAGRIIQALISRQREFLADASAVQFTRNPEAMVKALGRLSKANSNIQTPTSDAFAHCFFASASNLTSAWGGPFATHPPLEARMAAINPQYANIIADLKPIEVPTEEPTAASTIPAPTHPALQMIAMAGALSSAQVSAAATLTQNFSPALQELLATTEGCVSLTLAGALSYNEAARAHQLAAFQSVLSPEAITKLSQAFLLTSTLKSAERVAVSQLALGRTRQLDTDATSNIIAALETLIADDGKLSLYECLYVSLVGYRLAATPLKPTHSGADAAELLLSALSDSQNVPNAPHLFNTLTEGLALPALSYRHKTTTPALREALPALRSLSFLQRRELLIAVSRALKLDGFLSPDEAELLRLIAAQMDIPVPSQL